MEDKFEQLIDAATRGDVDAVEKLLPGFLPIDEQDSVGCTALFWAVSSGHRKVAELLLNRGADPNIPENNGTTPLMDAASGGDLSMMRLLLQRGARAEVYDLHGDRAMDYATNQQQHSAAQFLRNLVK